MPPTLFDENTEEIAIAAQKKAWAFLQQPYSFLGGFGENATILDAILVTMARKAVKNGDVKAADFLLKIILRQNAQNGKIDEQKAVASLNDWLQSVENESNVSGDDKDAPNADSVG